MKIYVHSAEKDIKEVIGVLKELTLIKNRRLEARHEYMSKVEYEIAEAEIELLEKLIDKYDKY